MLAFCHHDGFMGNTASIGKNEVEIGSVVNILQVLFPPSSIEKRIAEAYK